MCCSAFSTFLFGLKKVRRKMKNWICGNRSSNWRNKLRIDMTGTKLSHQNGGRKGCLCMSLKISEYSIFRSTGSS